MSTFKLTWGAKVTHRFATRVIEIARRFAWPQEHCCWLMDCMAFESGETFSPSIKNRAGSGATGLIQFMPDTAAYLGTSPIELAEMPAEEQLLYVQNYFRPYAHRIKSLSDMYMTILLPRAIGAPESAPLFFKGIAYRQNSGLDTNHDGIVTKQEAARCVATEHARGMLNSSTETWFD